MMSGKITSGVRAIVEELYLAKRLHTQLFTDIGPESVHRELVKEFCGLVLGGPMVFPRLNFQIQNVAERPKSGLPGSNHLFNVYIVPSSVILQDYHSVSASDQLSLHAFLLTAAEIDLDILSIEVLRHEFIQHFRSLQTSLT